jgi:putative heme iron utilization protein
MSEESEKKLLKSFEARKLLKEQYFGVLSTISLDLPGYPFGSITPYCLSDQFEPLILISSIAQHTKNILADSKVSMTVFNPEHQDVQANGRVTYIGNAVKTDDIVLKEKYQQYFPASADYFNFHDFSLFKIELKRLRYIGGFGSIFWVEANELPIENPLLSAERRIINHMNEDHQDSLIKYCRVFKNTEAEKVTMIGIDSEGFDVIADKKNFRFTFDNPVLNAGEAREMLVKMARSTE